MSLFGIGSYLYNAGTNGLSYVNQTLTSLYSASSAQGVDFNKNQEVEEEEKNLPSSHFALLNEQSVIRQSFEEARRETRQKNLSTLLLKGTRLLHGQASRHKFIKALSSPEFKSKEVYGQYLRDLYEIYQAMESALEEQKQKEGPIQSLALPILYRSKALKEDLKYLVDPEKV